MLAAFQFRWRTAFTYAIVLFLLMMILSVLLALRLERWHRAQLSAQWSTYVHQITDAPAIRTALEPFAQNQLDLLDRTDDATAQSMLHLSTLLRAKAAEMNVYLSIYADNGTFIADSTLTSDIIARSWQTFARLPQATMANAPSSTFDQSLNQRTFSFLVPFESGASVRGESDRIAAADESATTRGTAAKFAGFIRVRVPVSTGGAAGDGSAGEFLRTLILPVTIPAGLLMMALMVIQAERSAYTLRRMSAAVEQITKGNLSARTLSLSSGEIGQLARAFNRMADKLQRQMNKRAREKDRLRTMLHVMTDGVLLLNRHGSVRVLNEAAAGLLNTSVSHALKRSFVQTVRDHRYVEVLRRCQASGQTETAVLEMDNGVVIRMIVTPFLQGRDRGHLVVLQDLTRLYQLQTTRQDFISNISHELRTPLASIRALTETLVDGAIDDKDAAVRFLNHMEVEVDALTQMVQELLQLSLIESGKTTFEFTETPAASLLEKGAERLRAQAKRAGIELVIDVANDLPMLCVDGGRVEQVLTNLVHNAIKFTPTEGTITLSACHSPESDAKFITVSVKDTGVGIAYEDLPRVFERFYKADRARSSGGTGLGLAIAKHIVHAHGGTIWAESAPSKGSTFLFTLPLADSSCNQ